MKSFIENKLQTKASVQPHLARWRFETYKTVFTNGCFDLIHFGHIQYLIEARELGDKLIVGLNSDASVQRLKGDHRPIKDQQSRALIMAAFEFVDVVIIFDEDTPYELIKSIQPDILVKGGDWQPEAIVGSDIVLEKGGEVQSLQFVEGYSTTQLEQKIKGH